MAENPPATPGSLMLNASAGAVRKAHVINAAQVLKFVIFMVPVSLILVLVAMADYILSNGYTKYTFRPHRVCNCLLITGLQVENDPVNVYLLVDRRQPRVNFADVFFGNLARNAVECR